jgi:RNA polymerase sigma factor (sigma-70 family)
VISQKQSLQWGAMLEAIANRSDRAGTRLYQYLLPIRRYFYAQLSREESEDRFHDVVLAVLRAIRLQRIRDPETIDAYAWATAKRIRNTRLQFLITERESVSSKDADTLPDASPDPETIVIRQQNRDIAARILAALPERDRELLIRYYVKAESREAIQAEMGLTPNQFRLSKSRAKALLTTRLRRSLTSSSCSN